MRISHHFVCSLHKGHMGLLGIGGNLMVCALGSRSSSPSLNPDHGDCIKFLDKRLNFTSGHLISILQYYNFRYYGSYKLYKEAYIIQFIFLFLLDLSCSSLSDLRDSEEVTKALKTAVGSKQVHAHLSLTDIYCRGHVRAGVSSYGCGSNVLSLHL